MRERLSKKFYDQSEWKPYMESSVNLKFPVVKTNLKLDKFLRKNELASLLEKFNKTPSMERNAEKVQNLEYEQQSYIEASVNSNRKSSPEKRNTSVSRDNNILQGDTSNQEQYERIYG